MSKRLIEQNLFIRFLFYTRPCFHPYLVIISFRLCITNKRSTTWWAVWWSKLSISKGTIMINQNYTKFRELCKHINNVVDFQWIIMFGLCFRRWGHVITHPATHGGQYHHHSANWHIQICGAGQDYSTKHLPATAASMG